MIEQPCERCQWRKDVASERVSVRDRAEGLNKVGAEHVPGRSRTDYTDWVCPDCGQEWTEIEDSGYGGHGRFLHPGRMR